MYPKSVHIFFINSDKLIDYSGTYSTKASIAS